MVLAPVVVGREREGFVTAGSNRLSDIPGQHHSQERGKSARDGFAATPLHVTHRCMMIRYDPDTSQHQCPSPGDPARVRWR
jgi:hypothetical protein